MPDIASLFIKVDSKGVVTASKDLNKLTDDSKKTEKATDGVTASFDKMKVAVAALATSYAALKTAQYIKDATLLAARYETLGVVMRVVGNNAGFSGKQMEGFARGLQDAGIAMVESRNTLTRMVQAQIDLVKSTDLARIAQDAAVIGNLNSSAAFERVIGGIQRGEVELLKTIGINVKFEDGYRKLEKTLGVARNGLTEYQKVQARTNTVVDAGVLIAGAYEGAMGTAGKQLLSLKRHTDNMKVSLGAAFTPALLEIVEGVTGAIKGVNADLADSKGDIEDWGVGVRLSIIDVEIAFLRLAETVKGLDASDDFDFASLFDLVPAVAVVNLLTAAVKELAKQTATVHSFTITEGGLVPKELTTVEALMQKRLDLLESLTPAAKAGAAAARKEAEEKVLAIQKVAAAEKAAADAKAAADDLFKKSAKERNKVLEQFAEDFLKATKSAVDVEKIALETRMAEYRKFGVSEIDLEVVRQEGLKQIREDNREDPKDLAELASFYEGLKGFEQTHYDLILELVDLEAEARREAGVEEVAVAQWVADRKREIEQELFEDKTQFIADGLGDLKSSLSGIAGLYDKGSDSAKQWESAAQALEVAQKAVAVVNAVAAISSAAAAPFPANFVAMASMASAMVSLLASAGISFGGGSSVAAPLPRPGENTTVLGGDTDQASESIDKSLDLLEDMYDLQNLTLTGINDGVQDLNRNIESFVTGIVRSGDPAAFAFAGAAPGIVGGVTAELRSLADVLGVGNVAAIGAADLTQRRLDFLSTLTELERTGTGEEVAQAIRDEISNISDLLTEDVFGELLTQYQKIGEGAFETVIRVATGFAVVTDTIDTLNLSFSGTNEETIALSESLISIAGGLQELSAATDVYYKKFFTEEEKRLKIENDLLDVFDDLGEALPETREGFRDLVESLDLTDEANQKAFVTLMNVSRLSDEYYENLERMAQNATDAVRGVVDDQISLMRDLASEARSAADAFRSISAALSEAQRNIRGSSIVMLEERLDSIFATALTGDIDALTKLPGAINEFLTSSLATSESSVDFARDQGKSLLMLTEAKAVADTQASYEEQQLSILEDELSVLEQIRDLLSDPIVESPEWDAVINSPEWAKIINSPAWAELITAQPDWAALIPAPTNLGPPPGFSPSIPFTPVIGPGGGEGHSSMFAAGGVFTNGVVTQPTRFNDSMMGEAGPEAIMPLTRGPNGLGVRAAGGSESPEQTALLKRIITTLESGNFAIAKNTGLTARRVNDFHKRGMPPEREI